MNQSASPSTPTGRFAHATQEQFALFYQALKQHDDASRKGLLGRVIDLWDGGLFRPAQEESSQMGTPLRFVSMVALEDAAKQAKIPLSDIINAGILVVKNTRELNESASDADHERQLDHELTSLALSESKAYNDPDQSGVRHVLARVIRKTDGGRELNDELRRLEHGIGLFIDEARLQQLSTPKPVREMDIIDKLPPIG